jgi:hypothetical protein
VLKMSRRCRLKFKALCFSKSYDVRTECVARPGSDLMGVIKSAESKAGGARAAASGK